MKQLCLREGVSNMSRGLSDNIGDCGRLLCRHTNKAKFFKNVKRGEAFVPVKRIKEDN